MNCYAGGTFRPGAGLSAGSAGTACCAGGTFRPGAELSAGSARTNCWAGGMLRSGAGLPASSAGTTCCAACTFGPGEDYRSLEPERVVVLPGGSLGEHFEEVELGYV